MSKFKKFEPVVTAVMEGNPMTRDDDDLLYIEVVTAINPIVGGMTATAFFKHRNAFGVPSYGSVARVGRKVRKKREDLRSSAQSLDAKYETWKEARDYAIKV